MTRSYLIPVLIAALLLAGCQGGVDGAKRDDVTGIYYLVKVDGSPVPASVSHDGTVMDVRSGMFMISENGRCFSRTRFVPTGGEEMTREAYAKFRVDDSRLVMRWEGAGTTEGTVEGDTFVMDNHGMVFQYEK